MIGNQQAHFLGLVQAKGAPEEEISMKLLPSKQRREMQVTWMTMGWPGEVKEAVAQQLIEWTLAVQMLTNNKIMGREVYREASTQTVNMIQN